MKIRFPAKPAFRHWRSLHGYVGITVSLLMISAGITGFFMIDREKPYLRNPAVFAPLRWWYSTMPESKRNEPAKLEYIELFTGEGKAVQVAADRGMILIKPADTDVWTRLKDSPWSEELRETRSPKIKQTRSGEPLTWRKVIVDLHSGKFFVGRIDWLYQFAALMLVLLATSGIYLWLKPRIFRMQKE